MSELFFFLFCIIYFIRFFVHLLFLQVREHSPNKSNRNGNNYPPSIHPREFCLYTSLALGCNYLLMSCKAVFSLTLLPLKTFNYLG